MPFWVEAIALFSSGYELVCLQRWEYKARQWIHPRPNMGFGAQYYLGHDNCAFILNLDLAYPLPRSLCAVYFCCVQGPETDSPTLKYSAQNAAL